jgi:hypothetical protein
MPDLMASLYMLICGLLLSSSLHTPPTAMANNGDTLSVGQTLVVGEKLISRNGKFAFGFFQFQPAPGTTIVSKSTLSSLGWYLGIWFNKIPVFTPVWIANRDKPITYPELRLTQLKISRDGNLIIASTAESTLWSTAHFVDRSTAETSTNTTTNAAATTAVLMDNGNLALIAAGSSSSNGPSLWQSFDYPTDVGLPGAKLGRNKVTGLNGRFISKKNHIDPALGSYILELDTNGVLSHRRRKPPFVVYLSWPSGKLAYTLVKTLIGLLDTDARTKGLLLPKYVNNHEEEYFTYESLDESSSTFVSIDVSGQIKLNIWSQEKQSWQTVYAQPADPCSLPDVCGPFTVCDGNSSPLFCSCMESFSPNSPRDWEAGDPTGGCVRSIPLECTASNNKNMASSSSDMFHTIARVTYPRYPHSIQDATTQRQCAEACLGNCSCTAYSYNNNKCSVWYGELLSVNRNDGIDNFSDQVLYLRLPARDSQDLTRNNKRKPSIVTVASIASCGFIVFMLLLLLIIWSNKLKWCGMLPLHGSQGSGGGLTAFRYSSLVHATKNFSERLGGGGFGSVFKGVLGDQTMIAVKKLDGARQGDKQFRAEVSSIGLIQHINLVKLIGFCCEGDKRLLVYEHMSKGSLDSHLFKSNASVINWSTRYKIAIGVARGLCYLHQSCHECIIHCDIKPENILLDASFVPKIADFGMAAIIGRDFSRVLTTFRGTAGYLAPEWLSGVAITPKVDVYSFGMVLLEIISGRRNSPEVYSSNSCHVAYFPVQAIGKLHAGDIGSLVDPRLQGDFDLEEVERVFKVAFWCIQDNEFDRPTMGEMVRALEGLRGLDMPPMPRLLAAIAEPSHAA